MMGRDWGPLLLKMVLVLVMAVVVSRSVFLVLVMGKYYQELAADNMIKRVRLDPVRGVITDKEGKALAMNMEYEGKTIRHYPYGEMLAPVIGYLSKPTEEELKNCEGGCQRDLLLGKAGLEKEYQSRLYGTAGEEIIEETASGQKLSSVSRVEPVNGENLKTNLDLQLQKQFYAALKKALEKSGVSGSVVVAKVSGEVLALVSLPSFDDNLFVLEGKRSDYGGEFKSVADLLADETKKPLFNRVVSGDFAPGSVYKLLPALAALEEKKIDKMTKIVDTGEIKIGEYRFGNWLLDKYGRTEGEIDVVTALSRSNDIFFYKIGEMLGVDKLVSWTSKLGLGELTGIDLPGESEGFLPTPLWREKTTGAKWFLGNTYHMSIGQGDLMATPLQINRMTAAVVGDQSCTLRLVGQGECTKLGVSESSRRVVLEGMKAACEPGGTAFPLFDWAGKLYCKTGTAQHGGKDDLPHAWVSVVVPRGEKVADWLVVTVLVESGGEGSAVAAPVAAEVMPYLLGESEAKKGQ